MTQVRSSSKFLLAKCNPYSSFIRFFLPLAVIMCPAARFPRPKGTKCGQNKVDLLAAHTAYSDTRVFI
jgi:hypothetical protein